MADEIKILGQLAAAATTVELLYTTPNLAQTTVSTLSVCNRTGAEKSFRVSVHQDDENPSTPDDKQYLFYDTPLAANSTVMVTIGMTFNQGDTIRIYASAIGLSFNLFGVETT